MDAVLEFREISKHFHAHAAVSGLSLAVERGELFCLLGPSGSGKTTALRMAAGFDQPSAGDILLNGETVTHLPPYRRNVCTVFQNYALFPHMSVRENIEFGLRRRGAENVGAAVAGVIELVQLAGKESRRPASLSGGERQRVALARSLVLRPEVLLLDEPFAALDPNLRKQVRGELKALQRRTGITFLMVTHDQEEALSISDRIGVMNAGRLEQTGTPLDLYLRQQTRFIAGFLGPVNWIDSVGVRPEATRISRDRPAGRVRSTAAMVEGSAFLGNCFHVESRLASGGQAVSEVSRLNGRFERGDPVYLWWEASDELHLPADS